MKDEIRKIIQSQDPETLTAKIVRGKLEEALGLEEGSLSESKEKKKEISALIDEVMAEFAADEEEEEEEAEAEPAAKKAKTNKLTEKKAKAQDDDEEEGGGKAKMTCETRSGDKPPGNVKKIQEGMKMSRRKFLKEAGVLKLEVEGNTLTGEPRSFKSDAMGWYLGGKIEIPVGDTTVWAQMGVNVVIPGSNAWKA